MTNDVIFEEGPGTTVVFQNKQSPLVSFLLKIGIVKSEAAAHAILLTGGAVCISLAIFIFLRTVNEPGINPERDIPPLTRTPSGQM